MIKLNSLKLANAIKVGPGEETFFRDQTYDLYFLDNTVLSVTHRGSGQTTYTSIFNTVYWSMDKAKPAVEAKDAKQAKAPLIKATKTDD